MELNLWYALLIERNRRPTLVPKVYGTESTTRLKMQSWVSQSFHIGPLDDEIIEPSITPNRADASMRGVAHEVVLSMITRSTKPVALRK